MEAQKGHESLFLSEDSNFLEIMTFHMSERITGITHCTSASALTESVVADQESTKVSKVEFAENTLFLWSE